jgi:hypothetical protein
MKRKMIKDTYLILLTMFLWSGCSPSNTNSSFPLIGKVQPRNASEIESSNWLVGCETLDRDFADYDQYKEYLNPLGIKRIRLQGGWAKTEKVKGEYNWAWLDHIINDATQRGLQPWVQFSYGNTIYEGGGGINLAAGIPNSEEALAAWDDWVAAMVTRYKEKVQDWQVWNEPNFGSMVDFANAPEVTSLLNIRTIDIVKSIQPEARVSGLTMGHIDLDYADKFLKILADSGRLELFDNIVYHDYVYNPDSNYPLVMELRAILDKYAPEIPLRQGENGAPSLGGPGRGAIGNHDWTELSQAKWNTRRMLGDLGHDIESSVFSIIDMAYTSGPIRRLNVKGLIMSDSTKQAIRPKMAYYAVQNVASIFDNTLERIEISQKTSNEKSDAIIYSSDIPTSLSVYAYKNKSNQRHIYTIWANGDIPNNSTDKENVNFTFTNANFKKPVYVDIITGKVYKIPRSSWSKKGSTFNLQNIPVYDAPILIADESLIQIKK